MTSPAYMSRETLAALLWLDNETGILRWVKSPNGRVPAGSVAGKIDTHGYRQISIKRKQYFAHHIVWLFAHGKWPTDKIDHINGCTDDNRLCNLREATHTQNMQNARRSIRNTSGFKGVSFHKGTKKWAAHASHKGTKIYLGIFPTPEQAFEAYCTAAKRLYGQFARTE